MNDKQMNINELNKSILKINSEVKIAALQLSVLRMQIHTSCRLSTATVSTEPQIDRKKILDKNSITWSKNKTKIMSVN